MIPAFRLKPQTKRLYSEKPESCYSIWLYCFCFSSGGYIGRFLDLMYWLSCDSGCHPAHRFAAQPDTGFPSPQIDSTTIPRNPVSFLLPAIFHHLLYDGISGFVIHRIKDQSRFPIDHGWLQAMYLFQPEETMHDPCIRSENRICQSVVVDIKSRSDIFQCFIWRDPVVQLIVANCRFSDTACFCNSLLRKASSFPIITNPLP